MTFFKEIQVGKFVLRFMPSDNGWMCGISKEMMDALESSQRTWVGLTNGEMIELSEMKLGSWDLILEVEAKLKEKNT